MESSCQQNISTELPQNKSTLKLTRAQSQSLTINRRSQERNRPGTTAGSFYGHIPMLKETPQWNKSASTLRHTSTAFRFSRTARFPEPKCNYQDSQQLQYGTTMANRARSQGFGKKASIPEVFSSGKFKSSQNCPFYQIDTDQIQRSNSSVILGKGKTFGIGWASYQASRTPHRGTVHSSYQQKSNPGPNRYNVNPEDNESPKILMHQRLEMFTSKNGSYRRNQPHPQSYPINQKLVKRQKSGTSFGLGNKTDFTKVVEHTPGPIYKQKSAFDKFVHLKLKLNAI